MNTAQLSQSAPRFVSDFKPAVPNLPPQPLTPVSRPQLVSNLPVENPNLVQAPAFKPIMSAEHQAGGSHEPAPQPVQDTTAHHETAQAAHTQPPAAAASANTAASAMTVRKPILETVVLVTACITICAMMVFLFKR